VTKQRGWRRRRLLGHGEAEGTATRAEGSPGNDVCRAEETESC